VIRRFSDSASPRRELARYVAPKGSVALDGTSLTVNAVEGCEFEINIIPHTQQVTTWGEAREGRKVNVERLLNEQRERPNAGAHHRGAVL